jgi:two-component system, response regulator YesN
MNVKLAIGISKKINNIEEIPSIYNYYFDKLQDYSFINGSALMFEEEKNTSTPVFVNYPMVQIKKIVDGLKNGDIKIVQDELNLMTKFVSSNCMNMSNIKKIYFEIVTYCKLVDIDKSFQENQIGSDSADIFMRINQVDTLNELNRWMIETILNMIDTSTAYVTNTDNKVIQNALKYIMNNYMKDITLSSVATYIHIHPVYFGRLLKKEVGENFCELVMRLRIQSAKNLLKQTNYKTYEIAEKVGFNDSRYFGQVFKKATSLTPKEFRDKN